VRHDYETETEYFARMEPETLEGRRRVKFYSNTRIDYYAGLHIGQVTRPAALAVVEVTFDCDIGATRHAVSFVEQFKPGTNFPSIINRALNVYSDGRIQEACNRMLVLDATYCGMALLDLLDTRLPNHDYARYTVAESGVSSRGVTTRQDLTVQMQRLLQEKRIQVSPDVQDASGVAREMKDYRVQVSDTGAVQYGGGPKHPRIAAIAIACWHSFWWEPVAWSGYMEHVAR